MRNKRTLIGAAAILLSLVTPAIAENSEVFRNDKVIVSEETLAPGEQQNLTGGHAGIFVVLAGEAIQMKYMGSFGLAMRKPVQRGDTFTEATQAQVLKNMGRSPLKLVRVEFLTAGSREMWNMTGLPPNYHVLHEDRYNRTYDIRIAPQAWEPQHTHHDRVVVCLSGAKLEHVLPDGSVQPSTLTTDEVAWRPGQTHKGHNVGDTELWAIAIEPK